MVTPAPLPAPLDLVWAVSGRGMLLRAIVAAADAGLLPVRIVGVVTDRPCPIEPFAIERGIPLTRVAPPDAERLPFDRAVADAFRRSQARWAGLTFNRLIGREPIECMQGRVLNIHFALLPLFPGFGPLRQAISSGMRVAGVTIHVVDQSMDGGAILAQTACGLAPDDTEASLGRRLFEAAVPLLLQTVRMLANGELSLDGDRRPAWSPGTPAALTGAENPSVDGDLARFGRRFCASHG